MTLYIKFTCNAHMKYGLLVRQIRVHMWLGLCGVTCKNRWKMPKSRWRTVLQMLSHQYCVCIFGIITCMGTREDIAKNKDKSRFNLEETSNDKSKHGNFDQKTQFLWHFWVPYWVTGTVTLVMEHHIPLHIFWLGYAYVPKLARRLSPRNLVKNQLQPQSKASN